MGRLILIETDCRAAKQHLAAGRRLAVPGDLDEAAAERLVRERRASWIEHAPEPVNPAPVSAAPAHEDPENAAD